MEEVVVEDKIVSVWTLVLSISGLFTQQNDFTHHPVTSTWIPWPHILILFHCRNLSETLVDFCASFSPGYIPAVGTRPKEIHPQNDPKRKAGLYGLLTKVNPCDGMVLIMFNFDPAQIRIECPQHLISWFFITADHIPC